MNRNIEKILNDRIGREKVNITTTKEEYLTITNYESSRGLLAKHIQSDQLEMLSFGIVIDGLHIMNRFLWKEEINEFTHIEEVMIGESGVYRTTIVNDVLKESLYDLPSGHIRVLSTARMFTITNMDTDESLGYAYEVPDRILVKTHENGAAKFKYAEIDIEKKKLVRFRDGGLNNDFDTANDVILVSFQGSTTFWHSLVQLIANKTEEFENDGIIWFVKLLNFYWTKINPEHKDDVMAWLLALDLMIKRAYPNIDSKN